MDTAPRTGALRDTAKNPAAPVRAPAEDTVGGFARRRTGGLLLALAAWTLLVRDTLAGLAAYWARDPEYSHGFLVPPIAAALVWSRRRCLAALPTGRSAAGLALLVGSLALFFAGQTTANNSFQRLGAWGALGGGAAFVLGGRFLAATAVPWVFLLFAIPPPWFVLDPVRLALKSVATRLSADLLGWLGLQALPDANVLLVGGHRLEVADACSGIRSLVAITATAFLFACLFRTGILRGAALILTAVPVTIAVNVARIAAVALALVRFDLDLTRGAAHDAVGFLVFGCSLVLLWASYRLWDWLLRWPPATGEDLASRKPPSHPTPGEP